MANKPMWDFLDKVEGRKDSSYNNLQKERVRQGYKHEKHESKAQEKKEHMAHKFQLGKKFKMTGKEAKEFFAKGGFKE